MNIPPYLAAHWVGWATAAATGVLGWLVANALAKPIVKFWSDRTEALTAVQEHGAVGPLASEQRVIEAKTALRITSAKLRVYAQGGPAAVRVYAWLRRYDIGTAGLVLNGLHDLVGDDGSTELRRSNADAVRICLGATAELSPQRIRQVRQMMREATGGPA